MHFQLCPPKISFAGSKRQQNADQHHLPTPAEPKSLAPKALHDELRADIEKYPELKLILPLLEACFNPGDDWHDDVENALHKLDDEVASTKPPKDKTDADKLIFKPSKEVFEKDGSGVLCYTRPSLFENWGLTVEYEISAMFEPHSVEGVRNVVKWAKKKGKKVRCAGFRHTWSDLYGATGDITMIFQPLASLIELPYFAPKGWTSDMQGVSMVPTVAGRSAREGHAFVKIMAGTTNDYFRQWCFDNRTVCIPFNVIMVEVTFGGTNAPICHGSGLSSSTLSDLVMELSYVDANGDLQTVTDREELRTASGCFGLLGVVVSLTLELDKMARAELIPVKQHYALAVPPPKGYNLPQEVRDEIDEMGLTEEDFEKARQEFVKRCDEDYYLEWFWFPYQRYVWTNTWKRYEITAPGVLGAFPGGGLNGVEGQWAQGALAEAIVNWPPWYRLSGYLQAFLFGLTTLAVLPNVTDPRDKINTYVSEALHFRRGIQNFRVWDTEWEIPIPAGTNGKRDYELVQRAWWDGISAIYNRPDAPVRVALEMRLTGSSNVLLAPQTNNTFGTASIEVLTTLTTPTKVWKSFCQEVADLWTSYRDKDGNLLNARPHWAKQWQGLTVHGKPIERYMKEDAFKSQFEEFRNGIETITSRRGSSTDQTLERFGNKLLQQLIWG